MLRWSLWLAKIHCYVTANQHKWLWDLLALCLNIKCSNRPQWRKNKRAPAAINARVIPTTASALSSFGSSLRQQDLLEVLHLTHLPLSKETLPSLALPLWLLFGVRRIRRQTNCTGFCTTMSSNVYQLKATESSLFVAFLPVRGSILRRIASMLSTSLLAPGSCWTSFSLLRTKDRQQEVHQIWCGAPPRTLP